MRDKHISLCWGFLHWWILEITLNMAKTDQGDRVQGLHRFRRFRREPRGHDPRGTGYVRCTVRLRRGRRVGDGVDGVGGLPRTRGRLPTTSTSRPPPPTAWVAPPAPERFARGSQVPHLPVATFLIQAGTGQGCLCQRHSKEHWPQNHNSWVS